MIPMVDVRKGIRNTKIMHQSPLRTNGKNGQLSFTSRMTSGMYECESNNVNCVVTLTAQQFRLKRQQLEVCGIDFLLSVRFVLRGIGWVFDKKNAFQ